ncbi:MAG: hypothetical protein KTR20_08100 [Cellvibrionaceae bacterium]|nr:hypothetical protein [Cellvibrionaceae bacterium]
MILTINGGIRIEQCVNNPRLLSIRVETKPDLEWVQHKGKAFAEGKNASILQKDSVPTSGELLVAKYFEPEQVIALLSQPNNSCTLLA